MKPLRSAPATATDFSAARGKKVQPQAGNPGNHRRSKEDKGVENAIF
jgi:hypothetical protein